MVSTGGDRGLRLGFPLAALATSLAAGSFGCLKAEEDPPGATMQRLDRLRLERAVFADAEVTALVENIAERDCVLDKDRAYIGENESGNGWHYFVSGDCGNDPLHYVGLITYVSGDYGEVMVTRAAETRSDEEGNGPHALLRVERGTVVEEVYDEAAIAQAFVDGIEGLGLEADPEVAAAAGALIGKRQEAQVDLPESCRSCSLFAAPALFKSHQGDLGCNTCCSCQAAGATCVAEYEATVGPAQGPLAFGWGALGVAYWLAPFGKVGMAKRVLGVMVPAEMLGQYVGQVALVALIKEALADSSVGWFSRVQGPYRHIASYGDAGGGSSAGFQQLCFKIGADVCGDIPHCAEQTPILGSPISHDEICRTRCVECLEKQTGCCPPDTNCDGNPADRPACCSSAAMNNGCCDDRDIETYSNGWYACDNIDPASECCPLAAQRMWEVTDQYASPIVFTSVAGCVCPDTSECRANGADGSAHADCQWSCEPSMLSADIETRDGWYF